MGEVRPMGEVGPTDEGGPTGRTADAGVLSSERPGRGSAMASGLAGVGGSNVGMLVRTEGS